MKTFWILEQDTFDEDAVQELRKTLDTKGVKHATVEYVPFTGSDKIQKYIERPDLLLIPYGSIQFMKQFIRELDYAHNQEYGTKAQAMFWCNFNALNWANYSSYWSDFLASNEFGIVPYGVLKKNLEFYFDKFGLEDNHASVSMFIRPCSNDKVFTGQVLHRETAAHRLDYMGYNVLAEISPDILTVIAKPQKILGEWRSLVVDGKIITTSSYSTANNIHKEENADGHKEVVEFLNNVVKHEWQPDDAYVADVARIGNKYRLLEIGSPNCAGWYKMNVEKVVEAIECKANSYIESLAEL